MFTLRSTRQPAFVRQLISSNTPTTTFTARRFAHQDYGSGATKSKESNPAVDQEHPGPPPPKVAQGGDQKQQEQSQPSQEKSSSDSKGGKDGAQPKILADNPPAEGEEPEDVAKHNKEMQQRADRPAEKVKNEEAGKDKVHKGYWAGAGGRDREP